MTLSISVRRYKRNSTKQCSAAECRILFTIMLNVVMLGVVMLNVAVLSVIAPPKKARVFVLDKFFRPELY